MSLPWTDWQFYVVTAAAVWGAVTLGRQILPRGGSSASPACGGCAAGAAACAKRTDLVQLGVSRPSSDS